MGNELSIFDNIRAKELSAYIQKVISNQEPYLGEGLFPAQKTAGLTMEWLEQQQELPIALTMSELDTKPTVRDRKGYQKKEKEMPFFRESMLLKEKDRQDLTRLLRSNPDSPYVKPIIKTIFDDRLGLVEGGRVQAERMRMQLLSGFKVDISFNRLRWQVNYDPVGQFSDNILTLTGGAKWTDYVNSNPVEHIRDRQRHIRDETGVELDILILTTKTWDDLMQNKVIIADIERMLGSDIILDDSDMESYLKKKLKLKTIVRYDKKYQTEKRGATAKYFPDDTVTLLPSGKMGNTWYGTTPEEADALTGLGRSDVEIVNTGIAILTRVIDRTPVNVETVVSAVMGCSFQNIMNTAIIKTNG